MTGVNLEFAPLAVELFVPDVSEAVRFYTEKLGFRLVRSEHGQPTSGGQPLSSGHQALSLTGGGPESSHTMTFALTALGSAVFMFMSDAYYAGPRQHLASGRGEGIDIRVMVDDVDAIHDRAVAAGMTIVHPIADRNYGLRDFIIRDPWGFRLRFASPLR